MEPLVTGSIRGKHRLVHKNVRVLDTAEAILSDGKYICGRSRNLDFRVSSAVRPTTCKCTMSDISARWETRSRQASRL